MSPVPTHLVSSFRVATRHLVRELGLMNKTFSETGLGLTEVHAVMEVAARPGITARDLSAHLLLEKSTISRLIKGLIRRGYVRESRADADGRAKNLFLTSAGEEAIGQIDRFAEGTIRPALNQLPSGEQARILASIRRYGDALSRSRAAPEASMSSPMPEVHRGYKPGLVGGMAALHGIYYSETLGFAPSFEVMVAEDMGDLTRRLDDPDSDFFSVWAGEDLMGAVAIDGQSLAQKEGRRVAQLRCFIVSSDVQGMGLGRALLNAALDFCDARGIPEVQLFTLRELPAALHLYHQSGFTLFSEEFGDAFGAPTHLQWLSRLKP